MYWHFVRNRRLKDGRMPAPPGGVEVENPPIVPHARGLHASPLILTALVYAPLTATPLDRRVRERFMPRFTLRLVALDGEVVRGNDEIYAASERHILATASGNELLREFTREWLEVVRPALLACAPQPMLDPLEWAEGWSLGVVSDAALTQLAREYYPAKRRWLAQHADDVLPHGWYHALRVLDWLATGYAFWSALRENLRAALACFDAARLPAPYSSDREWYEALNASLESQALDLLGWDKQTALLTDPVLARSVVCGRCGGAGLVPLRDDPDDLGAPELVDCPLCGGSGLLADPEVVRQSLLVTVGDSVLKGGTSEREI